MREARCEVCNSVEHMEHSCFISRGVPEGVKLTADFSAEINRLHSLHVKGQFSWKTTQTTLRWLIRAQAAARDQTATAAVGEVSYADDDDYGNGHFEGAIVEPTPATAILGGAYTALTTASEDGNSWDNSVPMFPSDLSSVMEKAQSSRNMVPDDYVQGGPHSRPFAGMLSDVSVLSRNGEDESHMSGVGVHSRRAFGPDGVCQCGCAGAHACACACVHSCAKLRAGADGDRGFASAWVVGGGGA